MRYLAYLFLAGSLMAQTPPRIPLRLAGKVKLNPSAHWGGAHWVCPEGWRLPGTKLPTQEEAVAKGITIYCIPPAYVPPMPQSLDPHGIWDVPQSLVEYLESATGKLTWKHYKVQYDPLRGRVLYFRVDNMTHPLRHWDDAEKRYINDFSHDPKNVVLTHASFEFDAVAGDLIAWKVWAQ